METKTPDKGKDDSSSKKKKDKAVDLNEETMTVIS